MTEQKFQVGDTVIVASVNAHKDRPFVERTVVKVGRVNVTLDGGYYVPNREKTFNMESGFETGNYNHDRVYTVQEWTDKQERMNLVARYRIAGLDEPYRRKFEKITNDQLRAILAIVEED